MNNLHTVLLCLSNDSNCVVNLKPKNYLIARMFSLHNYRICNISNFNISELNV